MNPERRNYHPIARAALLAMLLCAGPAAAQEQLTDIPTDCNNLSGLYTMSENTVEAGPTWVDRCETCVLGSKGVIKEKKIVWFPRRSCAADGKILLAARCVPLPANPGCFELKRDAADPESHDCTSNAGGPAVWHCVNKSLPVRCAYRESGATKRYRNTIGFGYCSKKRSTVQPATRTGP